MRPPGGLDVIERHGLTGVPLAHRPAQEPVAVKDPDLGRVARVVADGDGLADAGGQRRVDVAWPLETDAVASHAARRGAACMTGRRSRSSRLSGKHGRKPPPRRASSGASPVSPWTRAWYVPAMEAPSARSSRADDGSGVEAALPPARCWGG